MNTFKQVIAAIIGLLFLSGCAGPSYQARPISMEPTKTHVVIVHDDATREGFPDTMKSWLHQNEYSYEVVREGSKHNPEHLTLEYVGYWSWDLALYLERAEIRAYQGGQPVGQVEFRAPNSLNLNKFGEGAERIDGMMGVLFNQISISEANKKL